MPPCSPRRRTTPTALFTLCGLLATSATALALSAPAATAAPEGEPALDKHDRSLLAEATARGEKTVDLLLASRRGTAKRLAREVQALGGTIAYQADSVGYLRASVPTGRAEQIASLSAVETADLGEIIERVKPNPGGELDPSAPVAGPSASTTDDNPYMPTGETGAVEFKKTAGRDGRGTVIGILDSGVDLAHPALTTTTDGKPKIIDSVSATDPRTDGDVTWFDMSAASSVVNGPLFAVGGVTYAAPAGTYRFRTRPESQFGALYGGDVNRDGDTTDTIAVLWDEGNGNVRVDTDFDRDFNDEVGRTPLAKGGEVGFLGADRPQTPVLDEVPFTVQIDSPRKAVNLGIVTDAHGSHVAGITAANDMFGGAMDGQAPGAQIVSVQVCIIGGGCTAAGLIEGMIYAVETAKVDVVNMSIGGLPALNDGNNTRATIYNRLIRDNGTQIVISAGNSGPGLNTVGDPSVADDVVSVAAGVSKATWKANYGSDVETDQSLFPFSSRGPREDGGFKPTVSAPGSAISTTPPWLPGGPVAEAGYPLPPGYSMFNGTSMSSPQTAGALALLIGAAKADKLDHEAPALRRALTGSADFNPGLQAVEQGWGRIDVPGAYALLSELGGKGKRATTISPFTVSAPVCTEISQFLRTANRGQGLYNRCAPGAGGQVVGESRAYRVNVSGPAGTYAVRTIGDDGTFTAPATVTLRGDRAVAMTVTARAASTGLHSAIVTLDDEATPGVDHGMLATVIVAPTLGAPTFADGIGGSVQRNAVQRFLVNVPKGVPFLKADLSGFAAGSQVRFIATNPYGLPVDSTSSLACYTNRPVSGGCNPTSRTYPTPLAGVWEFTVESRRTSPLLDNPFRLDTTLVGVTVAAATATVTVSQPATFTLRNAFAPVVAKAQGSDLGSSFRARPTIADKATQTYTVAVPEGAETFTATIGRPSDLGADLDLTVTGPRSGQSADGDSEESVTISSPPAGTYTVTVEGYAVPAGTTAYDYVDVYLSPRLGSLVVTDEFALRPTGATWTVLGRVVGAQPAPAGRALFGRVSAVTPEGVVLGSTDVVVSGQPTP